MIGLKKPETEKVKFLKYFEMVQEEAGKIGKVFYTDTPDGHDAETDDLILEDIRGWLIEKKDIELFAPEWKKDKVTDSWYDYMCWAEWSFDGKNGKDIKIKFVFYP